MVKRLCFSCCLIASIFQVGLLESCSNFTVWHSETTRVLLESGNLFVTSDGCNSPCKCNGTWLSWGEWSPCNIPIPKNSNDKPQCYNSLQNRRRPCSLDNSRCNEFNWKLCLHKESCTGEWSQWTIFSGNCSDCTRRARNRTCMKDGKIHSGLCYPSGYNKETDFDVEVCPESECKTNILIYAATFGVRALLLMTTIVFAMWVKRRDKINRTIVQKRNIPSSTYRHYSFALDPTSLQIINSTTGSTENFYEETFAEPAISDIGPYSSAIEITNPLNENVYEIPLASTSLKIQRCRLSPPAGYRSRSVDDMIAQRTKIYETVEDHYSAASARDMFTTQGNLTPHQNQRLGTTTPTNNREQSDDDVYTFMSSPTTKDEIWRS